MSVVGPGPAAGGDPGREMLPAPAVAEAVRGVLPGVILVVAAVVVEDGRLLLARRREGDHLAGHWEFPGGKVDPGETPPAALVRELAEELGVRAETGAPFLFSWWEYPEKRVLILFYRCRIAEGVPEPVECAEVGWFGRPDLPGLLVPDADRAALEALLPELRDR